MTRWDTLFVGANLATVADGRSYDPIAGAALAVEGERIAWLGPEADLPGPPNRMAKRVLDLGGRWVTPGLIDCHTHLVHVGDRAREFEMRLEGATYEDIARAGGGIRSTMAAVRDASEDALFEDARPRLDALLAEGVTTVEIKSGYGLDVETECRMLRAARRLGRSLPVTVKTTYLGAHVLPPEYEDDADAYIDLVCCSALPAVAAAGLADAVDAFYDAIGFSRADTERVFRAARMHALPVKLHTDQFSDQGGGALAAQHGALSADHLEYLSEDGARAMAAAGTVAVLLPGAFYFLKQTRVPPIDAMRRHAVPMAVATDSNPGSSPVLSLLLMMNMASTLFGLTPAEALAGVTAHAARALGLADDRGTLAAGKRADLAVWDVGHPVELAYRIGANPCAGVIRNGVIVRDRGAFGGGC